MCHEPGPRSAPATGDQREAVGVPDRLDRQIDVQRRPVQVARGVPLHCGDAGDRRVAKPGEEIERQEQLLLIEEQPEAMPRDIADFRSRSAGSRRFASPSAQCTWTCVLGSSREKK
jgi:hypothetical protein